MPTMTDKRLATLIAADLNGPCSLARYLGFNLPPGKHTTLANSATKNGKALEDSLRRERRENRCLMAKIRNTCRSRYFPYNSISLSKLNEIAIRSELLQLRKERC